MTECFSSTERFLIIAAASLFVGSYFTAVLLLIVGFIRRVIARNTESEYSREPRQREHQ